MGRKLLGTRGLGRTKKTKKSTGQLCLSDLPRQCIAQKRYEMNEWIL